MKYLTDKYILLPFVEKTDFLYTKYSITPNQITITNGLIIFDCNIISLVRPNIRQKVKALCAFNFDLEKISNNKYKKIINPKKPNLEIAVKYRLSWVFGEYTPSPNKKTRRFKFLSKLLSQTCSIR